MHTGEGIITGWVCVVILLLIVTVAGMYLYLLKLLADEQKTVNAKKNPKSVMRK